MLRRNLEIGEYALVEIDDAANNTSFVILREVTFNFFYLSFPSLVKKKKIESAMLELSYSQGGCPRTPVVVAKVITV